VSRPDATLARVWRACRRQPQRTLDRLASAALGLDCQHARRCPPRRLLPSATTPPPLGSQPQQAGRPQKRVLAAAAQHAQGVHCPLSHKSPPPISGAHQPDWVRHRWHHMASVPPPRESGRVGGRTRQKGCSQQLRRPGSRWARARWQWGARVERAEGWPAGGGQGANNRPWAPGLRAPVDAAP
jgi:hypothetical protein